MSANTVDYQESPDASFPVRLRKFREAKGLSIEALAEQVGAKGYSVRRWELGSSRPSREAADNLSNLGFGLVDDTETNLASRSRVQSRKKDAPVEAKPVPGLLGATFPPWVSNGPVDQEAFYAKLMQLQMAGSDDPVRYSIVDQTGAGQRTLQAMLEMPKPTASSWSSNYGSHGWHRYVGRFPPHVVRALLNHFGVGPSSLVCDPFSGSGTTAVECRLLGVPFVGIEIGGLSHLMGKVKATFKPEPQHLTSLAYDYAIYFLDAEQKFLDLHPTGYHIDDVLKREGNPVPTFANIEKWFTPQAFLGVSLTVEFAQTLDSYRKDTLLLALSAKMRSIGNLDVDVVRAEYSKKPRENVDVKGLVTRHINKMTSDIRNMVTTHSCSIGHPSSIQLIEGSALSAHIDSSSVDAIITSPPYGVEALSYLRTHLLSYRSLASTLEHDPYQVKDQTIGSEYLDDTVLPEFLEIEKVSPTFAKFFGVELGDIDKKTRQRRAAMMMFFEDMHNIGLRMADWLKDGGKVAWVIGNKKLAELVIPTDKIIEESFRSSGLEMYDIIKHKLKTNNSNSQVPWQERIIQDESTMLFSRVRRK